MRYRPPSPLQLRRPMLALAVCVGAGTLAAWALPAVPSGAWWAATVAAGVVSAACAAWSARRLVSLGRLAASLALAAGFATLGAANYAGWRTLPADHVAHLAAQAPAQPLAFTGRIERVTPTARGVRLAVEVDSVARDSVGQAARGGLAVTLYPPWDTTLAVFPAFRPGDRIAFAAQVRALPLRRNPADFDYGGWLRRLGLHGTAWVDDPGAIALVQRDPTLRERVVVSVQVHVTRALHRHVRHEGARGLLSALLLADRSGLDAETREDFTVTGLAHLLAVSGLHVALVGLAVWALLAGLFRRFGWPRGAVEWGRAAVTLALLGVYVVAVGAPASVVRAFIMAAALVVGFALERKADGRNALGLAALVILLMRPAALFDVGFQLSFAAVGGLLTVGRWVDRALPEAWVPYGSWRRHVAGMLVASFAATLATLPVVLYHFGRVPLAGLVLNLAAIPLTGLTLTAGLWTVLLAPVPALADLLGGAAEVCGALLLEFSRVSAEAVAWSAVQASVRDALPLAAVSLGVLAAAAWPRPRARWGLLAAALACGVLALGLGLTRGAYRPAVDVLFLDVGQGDATLVRFPNGRHLLIDAGVRNEFTDQGARTIVPHLQRFGVRRLDAVVVTHPHADHFGGLDAVLRAVPVGRVLHNGQAASGMWARTAALADSLGVPLQAVAAGDTLHLDSRARVHVLYPLATPDAGTDPNEASVVLRVQFGQTAFLFTGDAEAGAEAALARRFGELLAADVVKVGHHGSETSSTPAFVRFADALRGTRYAVVSVAERNRYGLPDEPVLERWAAAGATVLETADEGAVWLRSDGREATRVRWR